jgi:hypothetical protein
MGSPGKNRMSQKLSSEIVNKIKQNAMKRRSKYRAMKSPFLQRATVSEICMRLDALAQ